METIDLINTGDYLTLAVLIVAWLALGALGPPLLIRYVFLKRPMQKHPALYFAIGRLLLFVVIGAASQEPGRIYNAGPNVLWSYIFYRIIRAGHSDHEAMKKDGNGVVTTSNSCTNKNRPANERI